MQTRQFFIKKVKGCQRLFLILPVAVLLLLASSIATHAQTVIKGWTMGAESSSHVDVSYRIVKCSPTGNAEVHLQVFNEKASADVAKFNVVIADATSGQSTTIPVSKSVALAELVIADCGNTLSDLKIAVPSGYDPEAVTVTITFIP